VGESAENRIVRDSDWVLLLINLSGHLCGINASSSTSSVGFWGRSAAQVRQGNRSPKGYSRPKAQWKLVSTSRFDKLSVPWSVDNFLICLETRGGEGYRTFGFPAPTGGSVTEYLGTNSRRSIKERFGQTNGTERRNRLTLFKSVRITQNWTPLLGLVAYAGRSKCAR
jgi:hypothetical protein